MVCGLGQLHIQCLTSTGPEFWTLLLNCVALLIVLSSTPVAFHHLLPLLANKQIHFTVSILYQPDR